MKQEKIKMLTWSDGPTTSTGFGRVAREVLKALYATGLYDITSMGINFLGTTPPKLENPSQSDIDITNAFTNYELIPAKIGKDGDPLGRNLFLEALEKNDWDVVWILQDTFLVAPMTNDIIRIKKQKGFKIVYYFPIDSEDVNPKFLESTRIADVAVVYNDWSKELVETILGEEISGRLYTIYHGSSAQDFFIIDEEKRKEIRKEIFGDTVKEDDILIIRSDSNQQRKDWVKTLQIVGRIAQKNKKVKFYANTDVKSNDFPLVNLARKYGFKPGENFLYNSVFTRGRNLEQSVLNQLYNIADIGISTTRGEGCGLFHYEMMSIGKPLLIADNTAHTEAVNAKAAVGILSGRKLNEKGNQIPNDDLIDLLPNDLGVLRQVCDVDDGETKLQLMIDNLEQAKQTYGENARDFMADKTWAIIGQKWVELFEKVLKKEDSYIWTPILSSQDASSFYQQMQVFSEMVKISIENARTEFTKRFGVEAPQINYLGNSNEQQKK
jgi:glycosyltransferase involved in cell wall biosynthesis